MAQADQITTTICPAKKPRSGGPQRPAPVIVNAETVTRSALISIIVAQMIGKSGGALQISNALHWKQHSGGEPFRRLLQLAEHLGIEVRRAR